MMNLREARELVVLAGKQLIKEGLIARTWGNVSCRAGDTQFLITPSGRAYDTLTADDIVLVNIEDCSYAGDLKPSSEKGIHAEVYKQRPEINFVIHTHQTNASVLSPLKRDIKLTDSESITLLGGKIICAGYGLPGTKKLKKEVAAALAKSDGKAFLMAYHGALCLGKDYNEAFRVASELEKVCEKHVFERYLELSGAGSCDYDDVRAYCVKKACSGSLENSKEKESYLFSSQRDGDYYKLFTGGSEEDHFPQREDAFIRLSLNELPKGKSKEINQAAEIHRQIYLGDKDVNSVIHSLSPDILALSRMGKKNLPYLDDFAQLIGVNLLLAENKRTPESAKNIARKLTGRNAVLIRDNGAICTGPESSDAEAALMVMEKGAKTALGISLFGKTKPINPLECRLMRFIYKTQYSKKKNVS